MAIAHFLVVIGLIGAAIMVGALWEWFADWRLIRATRRRISTKLRKSRRAA